MNLLFRKLQNRGKGASKELLHERLSHPKFGETYSD